MPQVRRRCSRLTMMMLRRRLVLHGQRRQLSTTSSSLSIEGTIPKDGKGIAVNQYAQVQRKFTNMDVTQFANLVGDHNPLHSSFSGDLLQQDLLQKAGLIQWDGKNTKPLVHGMLASSLFSCIFGTLIPGSVYRSQVLQFMHPIFADDCVIGRVQVIKVRPVPSRGGLFVVCDTSVVKEDDVVCIKGQAHVWLPAGTKR